MFNIICIFNIDRIELFFIIDRKKFLWLWPKPWAGPSGATMAREMYSIKNKNLSCLTTIDNYC